MKSMIEQTKEKPKTFRAKAKEKMKTMNQKVRRKSTANEVSDKPPAMTVEELRNLTFTLMDKVDERDERIKFKEYEKREMFNRILEMDEKIKSFEDRDVMEEEEVKEAAESNCPGGLSPPSAATPDAASSLSRAASSTLCALRVSPAPPPDPSEDDRRSNVASHP